jgi:hypothetical protein
MAAMGHVGFSAGFCVVVVIDKNIKVINGFFV